MTDQNQALVSVDGAGSGMLAAADVGGFIQKARTFAQALVSVVEEQKLYTMIQDKKYVNVEGWTTLAAMMGITPHEVENLPDVEGGYTATVEMKNADGKTISRASAECGGPSEPMWNSRPAYARRSMAATRATSKACRLAFSWIMTLGGYAPTPAEEMQGIQPMQPPAQPQPRPSNAPPQQQGGAPPPQQPAQYQQASGPNPNCPSCGKALRKSKYPDKDDGDLGYYCWKKQGGCGNKYKSYQVGAAAPAPMTPPADPDGYMDAVVEGEVIVEDQPQDPSLFDQQ